MARSSVALLALCALVCAIVGPPQQASAAFEAPWTKPADAAYPYKGLHNDLKQLMHVQRKGESEKPSHWLSIVAVTYPFADVKRFLLNSIYSLVEHGQQEAYIVAVFQDGLDVGGSLKAAVFALVHARARVHASGMLLGARPHQTARAHPPPSMPGAACGRSCTCNMQHANEGEPRRASGMRLGGTPRGAGRLPAGFKRA